jgi:catechol 2,3-dioxygenase-like lactoylglutathione lyase family enzyme
MQYGDPASPSFAYYTNRSEDWAGQFVSTPALAVELPKNNGGFDDAVCNIKLPSDAFVDRFTDGLPTSPCSVTVEEVTLPIVIGQSATILTLFTGKVVSTIRNKDGRSGSRLIKAKSWKAFFTTRLGMPADHQCPFMFNQIGCNSGTFAGGAPQALGTYGGTIATIVGHKITFTVAPTHARDNIFNKGYISYQGINIDIREYDAGVDPNAFYLTRQPPSDWVGATVVLFAGCDKTIENCRDWDNEQNFGGVGFGIPAYNPLFEDSP